MFEGTGNGQHPASTAVAGIAALLDDLGKVELWGMQDGELADYRVAIQQVRNRLDAAGMTATREIDARGLATAQGSASTGTWLRDRLRIDPAEGKRQVKIAASLDAECAATGEALQAGEITAGHAEVITKVMRRVAGKLPADERADAERQLLDLARVAEPEQVRKLGKHLEYVLDPDGPEPKEQAAQRKRALHLRDLGEGWQRLSAIVPDIDAAKLKAAIEPLSKPRPAVDGTRDERLPAQRRYDALMTIINRFLDHNEEPKSRGNRPHLLIVADYELLAGMAGAAPARTATGELISGEMLRKLACDAGITRVLTGPDSMPLDVGRKYRVATDAQFAALVIRDGGCTGPNCDIPAGWAQVHHLFGWVEQHGESNLRDLTLVCHHCHDLVHHGGWQCRMNDTGRIEFIPPPHVDPEQRPIINYYWKPRGLLDPPDHDDSGPHLTN